jgi:hypothetical protein
MTMASSLSFIDASAALDTVGPRTDRGADHSALGV